MGAIERNGQSSVSSFTYSSLHGNEGEGERAVFLADDEAIGGGLVDVVAESTGENGMHVVIDQYQRGT
jgi:hypothetical protein